MLYMWQKLWEGAENLTKTKPEEENDATYEGEIRKMKYS